MLQQPRKAYVLMGVEPELDCANPQQAFLALQQASLVVVMSAFKNEAALAYADVMLPLAPFTETSGTFVNIEGRVQSFNGVVKARGDARPGWKVLRVLGNVLNLDGFAYNTSEEVRDEVFGVAAEFVANLSNQLQGVECSLSQREIAGLQRIADVPIHFADQIARRAPALLQSADAAIPTLRANQLTLANLGVADGESVNVKQGSGSAKLTAKLDNNVPDACVRVAAAHATTAALGEMFGQISVERA